MADLVSIFGYISAGFSITGAIIAIISKIRDKHIKPLVKQIGKERLYYCLFVLNDLFNYYDVDQIANNIRQFELKTKMEDEMKLSIGEVNNIMKKISPQFRDGRMPMLLKKYDEEKYFVLLKNKKHWNRLKNDSTIDKAINEALNIMMSNMNLRKIANIQNERRMQINSLIQNIINNKSINREKRKELERLRDKVRYEESQARLDIIKDRLHDLFKEKSLN
jgi:hypothetical protein